MLLSLFKNSKLLTPENDFESQKSNFSETLLDKTLSHLNKILVIIDINTGEILKLYGNINGILEDEIVNIRTKKIKLLSEKIRSSFQLNFDKTAEFITNFYHKNHFTPDNNSKFGFYFTIENDEFQIRYIEQSSPFEFDSDGQPQSILSIIAIEKNNIPLKNDLIIFSDTESTQIYANDNLKKEFVMMEKLSQRETEIIKLLAKGYDSHAIGTKLFISNHTVDTHRRHILKKLHLEHTYQVVEFLVSTNLLEGLV